MLSPIETPVSVPGVVAVASVPSAFFSIISSEPSQYNSPPVALFWAIVSVAFVGISLKMIFLTSSSVGGILFSGSFPAMILNVKRVSRWLKLIFGSSPPFLR